MSEIKISVIIPIYNVQDYLAECLDSCICQDFPGAQFICVDDGSSDSSAAILGEYSCKDSRIVTVSKENGGLSSARNAGLKKASGEWIMFLDSDDKLKDGALKTFWECAEKGNRDIIVFHADTFPEDIENEKWYKKTLQFEPASYDSFSPKVLFEERGAMPFVWRQAFRKELLEQRKVLFDESLKFGEDVLFSMEVFPYAERFEFTDKCLLSYRLKREGSLMDSVAGDAEKIVDRHFEIIKHAADFWQAQGWLELWGADFLGWALKFTLLKVKALQGKVRKEKAAEMFEEIVAPYGLQKYKTKMGLEGALLWTAFRSFTRL